MKKYKNLLLAAASGLLLAASWPTYGFAPIIFLALVPLLLVEEDLGKTTRYGSWSLFGYSFITFLIFNIATTWWVCNSALIAGLLASGVNSFLMTLTFQLYHIVRVTVFGQEKGQLALIPFWIGFEKCHYVWEINWPWLTFGNVFATNPALIQWYTLTGVFGGTLWVLLVNILIFKVIKTYFVCRDRKNGIKQTIAPALLIAIPMIISVIIYNNYEEEENPVEVVVYQPNNDPYSEQYNLTEKELMDEFVARNAPLCDENTDFIVCPESMMQTSVFENHIRNASYVHRFRDFLKEYAPNAAVIVGASTYKIYDEGEEPPASARKYGESRYYDAFNTTIYIDTTETVQLHHKSKLTPGVEIMPYIKYMPFIENLALDLGGTVGTLGADEEMMPFWSMRCGGVPASVICYESVFGEHVTEFVRNYANMILISTNDGWWKETQGHKQHCAYASILAIETRRSVARAANTGISCVVNQRGDVSHETLYWTDASFKAQINLNKEVTFYSQHGDWLADIAKVLVIALIVIAVVNRVGLRKKV